ncbi:MAG: ATP-binding cassette domain-containing protein, partial [Armatimonadetes bacterium]|nr:ATP-binding cassette domain-containing protein [Armatimonadota bacterium]
MALISLSGVRKSFGASQILDEITFSIGAGEKVALVGPNGCGKTTVLHIIAGLDEPDSGQMQILPGTTIGYMPQDSELDGTRTLVEEVSNASVEVLELEARLRRLESAME